MKTVTPRILIGYWYSSDELEVRLAYGSKTQHQIFAKEFGEGITVFSNRASMENFIGRYLRCGFPLQPVIKYCAKELLRGTQKDLRLFLQVLQEHVSSDTC